MAEFPYRVYSTSGDDEIFGTSGDDLIDGWEGNDTICGLAGNDFLFGWSGNDVIDGGDGDDWIFGEAGTDILTGGAGNDTFGEYDQWLNGDTITDFSVGDVILIRDADIASFTFSLQGDLLTFSGATTPTFTGGSITLIGVAGAVFEASAHPEGGVQIVMTVGPPTGTSGDDTLHGTAGDDTLDGGAGADMMLGGAGNDTYYVDDAGDSVVEGEGEGLDAVYSSVSYTLAANVENLTLTGAAAINGAGNALANRLVGNSASNILDGGAGIDVMRGMGGNDIYYVDNVSDNVIENAGEGIDTVHSSASFSLRSNVEHLILSGSAIRGNGNNLDNQITGTDGNNIFNGGLGADTMTGGLGEDTYYVDNIGDTLIETADGGRERVYTTINWTLGENLEDLYARGSTGLALTGNELDNVLRGNSGNNILDGAGGSDDLKGGAGADTFVFRDGEFGGLTPSTADRIIDFTRSDGDLIDLSAVDANSLSGGDQAFDFIGAGAFTNVAGQLRYEQVNGNTYVYGDTNGDGVADFMIRVDGTHSLVLGDFVI